MQKVMKKNFEKLLLGYQAFREKYALGDESVMHSLSKYGQTPQVMVVACCDSRVDPALILQCDPGDLFVVRNVANIVPPFEKDEAHHGTSAALEFATCFLKIKHLILLGHSQCGGIQALLKSKRESFEKTDFIGNWVSILKADTGDLDADEYAKKAVQQSYENCLTFPWLKEKIMNKEMMIHQWFFDIKQGQILAYCHEKKVYHPLEKGLENYPLDTEDRGQVPHSL